MNNSDGQDISSSLPSPSVYSSPCSTNASAGLQQSQQQRIVVTSATVPSCAPSSSSLGQQAYAAAAPADCGSFTTPPLTLSSIILPSLCVGPSTNDQFHLVKPLASSSATSATANIMPVLGEGQQLVGSIVNDAATANHLSELQRKLSSPATLQFGASPAVNSFADSDPNNRNALQRQQEEQQFRRHSLVVSRATQQQQHTAFSQCQSYVPAEVSNMTGDTSGRLLGDMAEMSPQEILRATVNSASAAQPPAACADESVMRQRELEVASFLARCLDQHQPNQPVPPHQQQSQTQQPHSAMLMSQLTVPASSSSGIAASTPAGHLSSSTINLAASSSGGSASGTPAGADMRPSRSYSLSAGFTLNDIPQHKSPASAFTEQLRSGLLGQQTLQQLQLLGQLKKQEYLNEITKPSIETPSDDGIAALTHEVQQQLLALLRAQHPEMPKPSIMPATSSEQATITAAMEQRQKIILQYLSILKRQQEQQQLQQQQQPMQSHQDAEKQPRQLPELSSMAGPSKAGSSMSPPPSVVHLPRPVGRPRTRHIQQEQPHSSWTVMKKTSLPAVLHAPPASAFRPHAAPTVTATTATNADSDDEDGAKPADVTRQLQVAQLRTQDGMARQRLPYSNESCHTIIKFLMDFNLSSDVEFSKKAIESLIKRLRDKRDELDHFIQAVHKGGSGESSCVTIPRTLDGRLQVAGRKGFPHVVYARIFRWPDLHKNEIKHLMVCRAAFDMKCDSVCVNPFHYQRIAVAAIAHHPLHAHTAYHQHGSNVKQLAVGGVNVTGAKPASTLPNISNMHITATPPASQPIATAGLASVCALDENQRSKSQHPIVIDNFRNIIEEDQRAKNALVGQQHQQWLQKILAINEMLDKRRENGNTEIEPASAVPAAIEEVIIQSDSQNESAEVNAGTSEESSNADGDDSDTVPAKDSNSNFNSDGVSSGTLSSADKQESVGCDMVSPPTEDVGDSFLQQFVVTLRKEFDRVATNSQLSLNTIAKLTRGSNRESDELLEKPSLTEFLRYFPLTVSMLARLLSESRSNNPTPPDSTAAIEREDQPLKDRVVDNTTPELIVVDEGSAAGRNGDEDTASDNNQLKRKRFDTESHDNNDADYSPSTMSATADLLRFRLSSTDDDSQVSQVSSGTSNLPPPHWTTTATSKMPDVENNIDNAAESSALQPPPHKRRQLHDDRTILSDISSNHMHAFDEKKPIANHLRLPSPLTGCYSPALISNMIDEVRAIQRSKKFGCKLRSLLHVLETCLHKGSRRGMNLLIEAIFENINSRKMIPLMDLFNSEAPIFSILYNEFDEAMGKPADFFNSSVFCGSLPLPQEKQTLAIGTGKLAARWSPLQTQQIYDCRRRIAYGVGMEITDEGEVYVRCLSARPIYVESHYLDRESMRVNGDASHVIYQQAAIKVYDLWQSFQLMCFWITQKKFLSKSDNSTEKLILYMNQLCKFRISFGVDWGHAERPRIECTPCWIEVRLQSAHRMLENLLNRPEIAYNFVFNASKNLASCAKSEADESLSRPLPPLTSIA